MACAVMVLLTQQMAVLGTIWKFVPLNVRQDPILALRGCMQVLVGEASCYVRGGKAHVWFVSVLVENAMMAL